MAYMEDAFVRQTDILSVKKTFRNATLTNDTTTIIYWNSNLIKINICPFQLQYYILNSFWSDCKPCLPTFQNHYLWRVYHSDHVKSSCSITLTTAFIIILTTVYHNHTFCTYSSSFYLFRIVQEFVYWLWIQNFNHRKQQHHLPVTYNK